MSTVRTLVALAALSGPFVGAAETMRADRAASSLRVLVRKAGALSAFGHDHDFAPERWRADASLDPVRGMDLRVDLVVEAGSLHDHERGLSSKDRAKVERQAAGPEVLDAVSFPEIRYRGAASGLRVAPDGTFSGVLHGTLALHGASRPLDVPFEARPLGSGYLASGAASFRQSDFGIRPFGTAMGTIRVRDEVRVEFQLAFKREAT